MASWTREDHDGVAVLTFRRPPSNWMDLVSMGELADHLAALAEQSDAVKVVMLTGGLDGYFIAHADLDDLAKLAKGEPIEGDLTSWFRALTLLETMPQPTVAAIDGQAWGGGCETSLACTMRIGSERAHLGQPEVAIGIIPGAGGTQRLPRLVGGAIGAELCLTGRIVPADEAHRIGLLNAVLPTDGLPRRGHRLVSADQPPPRPAVFAAKQAVVEGLRGSLEDGLRLEGQLFLQLNASDDAKARNEAVPRGAVGPRRGGALMEFDLMTGGLPLKRMQELARDASAAGVSGLVVTEAGRTAYLSCAAAALAADLDLLTGVAVAFPRSPMVTASVAWELAEVSGVASGSGSAPR